MALSLFCLGHGDNIISQSQFLPGYCRSNRLDGSTPSQDFEDAPVFMGEQLIIDHINPIINCQGLMCKRANQRTSSSDSLVDFFPQTHAPTVYPRANHIVEFRLEVIYNETADTEALITRGRAAHYIPQTYLRLISNLLRLFTRYTDHFLLSAQYVFNAQFYSRSPSDARIMPDHCDSDLCIGTRE